MSFLADLLIINFCFVIHRDLYERSVWAREQLDEAGFQDVKIMVASNLNEWRIRELVDKKAPCDSFMAITELTTSSDAPSLEVVYKMAQIEHKGVIRQTMKLSPEKKSLPGRKQVYRVMEKGKMKKDIIGLEGENVKGKELLIPVIRNGKLVYKLPKLSEIKDYVAGQIKQLPEKLKKLAVQTPPYQIEISPGLKKLTKATQDKVC